LSDEWKAILAEMCSPLPLKQGADFPEHLRGTGLKATVRLLVVVNPCGQVRKAEVLESSGYESLDRAAVTSSETWVVDTSQFKPGSGGVARVAVDFVDDTVSK
jgi:TonB family protein